MHSATFTHQAYKHDAQASESVGSKPTRSRVALVWAAKVTMSN